ncbi:MAG: phage holin family protein [Rhodoglobus sp.]
MKLIARLLINALALWLTTLVVAGVRVEAFAPGGTLETILTFLLVAAIFGIVNGGIGTVVRIVAFPLYILTLGLVALLVNALLLLLSAWLSSLFGFGLVVDGFWWGVVGALVLGFLSWLIGILLRPIVGRQKNVGSHKNR